MTKKIGLLGTLLSILLLFSFVSIEKSSDDPKTHIPSLEGYRFDKQCQVGNGLRAEYFADTKLRRKVLTTIDPTVNFFLYRESPKKNVPADRFSVRWTGGLYVPESGPYTFYMNVDDGARIWIDDQLVLDEWDLHEPTEFSFQANLMGESMHKIKIEYVQYMFNEAVAQLSWSSLDQSRSIIPTENLYPCPEATCFTNKLAASSFGTQCQQDATELQGYDFDHSCKQGNGLNVQYFADSKLKKLVVEDIEPAINFSLYRERPRSGVPADEFSVRWQGGLFTPQTGIYDFYFTVDDGARVWIDDKLLLDEWGLNEPTEFHFQTKMAGGKMHTIRVEYVQFMFNEAVARFEWKIPNQGRELVPMTYLYSQAIKDCTESIAKPTTPEPKANKSLAKKGVIAVIITSILIALRLKAKSPSEL